MACPICGAHAAGMIGRQRYYCGECCHEWVEKGDEIKVYRITGEGTLYCLKLFRLQTA
jgi:transposase-like protein